MDWFPLWLSLRVAGIATVVAAGVGVAGGYLLARAAFPGRRLLEAVASLPIVLPPTVLGYYLLVLVGRDAPVGRAFEAVTGQPLAFTWQGAVLAATVAAAPFCLRTARAAIAAVEPGYEQAARAIGLGRGRVAWHVTLPLARRGIIAGVSLGFARALGDFGITVMVAGNIPGQTQTMPVAVFDAVQAGDTTRAGLMAVVLSLVGVAVLVLLGRLDRDGW